jgi:diadenosine tetraphosphate (Ap4A) HIT family hydrolase
MAARHEGCTLCQVEGTFIAGNSLAIAIRDRYPVSPLHTLIFSRRHASSYFDLYEPEKRAINLLLDQARVDILAIDKAVEGFNIGINCGEVAGQTIMHSHVHLVPRRRGDVTDPRGGVLGVIPGMASY